MACIEQLLFMKFCSAVLEEYRIRDWEGRTDERRTDIRITIYPQALFAGVITIYLRGYKGQRSPLYDGFSIKKPNFICLFVSFECVSIDKTLITRMNIQQSGPYTLADLEGGGGGRAPPPQKF